MGVQVEAASRHARSRFLVAAGQYAVHWTNRAAGAEPRTGPSIARPRVSRDIAPTAGGTTSVTRCGVCPVSCVPPGSGPLAPTIAQHPGGKP
jgi:hypothetical protein